MEKLINLLNELASKYNMEESDVKRIQAEIFSLEAPDASEDADLNATDFVLPNEEHPMEDAYGRD